MKLGDAISSVATPFARAFGADCIDPETNDLRPESGCAKARDRLNRGEPLFSVMYDRFFEQRTKGEKVKYILSIEIEAEDLAEAIGKKNEWKILAGNPRSGQQLQQSQPTHPVQQSPQPK